MVTSLMSFLRNQNLKNENSRVIQIREMKTNTRCSHVRMSVMYSSPSLCLRSASYRDSRSASEGASEYTSCGNSCCAYDKITTLEN